jgi:mannose-1-phosphate guanylyltransferase
MDALILAAGMGSRLEKFTRDIPKVLLPIKNQPLLDILIRKLIKLEIEKIIINTFYKANMVEDFLRDQDYFKRILISPEKKLLGTAGSLKLNLKFLSKDNFLVMHGDNYFADDLKSFVDFHKSDTSRSLMTMATFNSLAPHECGVVEIDSEKFIVNFHEKKKDPPTNKANAAIYLFKPGSRPIIQNLERNETDISNHLVPKLIGLSKVFELSGEFIDIGTPARYSLVR